MNNITYNVASSNVSMFKMKIFETGNKRDLTKMDMNLLLGQGIIRRQIIAHDLMF